MSRPAITRSHIFEPDSVRTPYQRRRWRAIYAAGVLSALGHSAAFIADALTGIDECSDRHVRRLLRHELLSDPKIRELLLRIADARQRGTKSVRARAGVGGGEE